MTQKLSRGSERETGVGSREPVNPVASNVGWTFSGTVRPIDLKPKAEVSSNKPERTASSRLKNF
jgi:hypothetical protein